MTNAEKTNEESGLPYRKCVAIFLLSKSKVFTGRRGDVSNAWQLPQGGIEEGEDSLTAAKRELFEETNVLSVKPLVSSNSYRYDFPQYVQRNILKKHRQLKYKGQEIVFWVFEFTGNEEEIDVLKKPQEFLEWKWMSLENLLDSIVAFKKSSYFNAIKDFQKFGIFEASRAVIRR
ncbi:MAG: RNA pyrophosphohydrolase [Holosporaceae bacterium]|nr:RNA pyrophosphohydrolase [Holosporaceae bacterium]